MNATYSTCYTVLANIWTQRKLALLAAFSQDTVNYNRCLNFLDELGCRLSCYPCLHRVKAFKWWKAKSKQWSSCVRWVNSGLMCRYSIKRLSKCAVTFDWWQIEPFSIHAVCESRQWRSPPLATSVSGVLIEEKGLQTKLWLCQLDFHMSSKDFHRLNTFNKATARKCNVIHFHRSVCIYMRIRHKSLIRAVRRKSFAGVIDVIFSSETGCRISWDKNNT